MRLLFLFYVVDLNLTSEQNLLDLYLAQMKGLSLVGVQDFLNETTIEKLAE